MKFAFLFCGEQFWINTFLCFLRFGHTFLRYIKNSTLGGKTSGLTFLRFRSVLASVSVEDALLLGLRGTSCVTDAKLERDAQLFQRWRWVVVVSSRWTSKRSRTTGSRTTGKLDVKDWTKRADVGSDGSFF